MSNIYQNNTYLTNNPTWHEEDAPFKIGKILALLEKHPVTFKTVGEIGCGSGEILVQLAKNLPSETRFYGFDISEAAIAIAKQKETESIQFRQEDITVKEANQAFDLLLIIDVIEHIDNYFGFLDSIVAKGRYTLFHIPLDMCMWSLFREQMLIESKNRVGHIHNFTEYFILNILEEKGFKVIDKIYTEPSFEKTSFKQSIVNALRTLLFKIHPRFCTKTIGGYSIMVLTENKP